MFSFPYKENENIKEIKFDSLESMMGENVQIALVFSKCFQRNCRLQ